ncbi:MAG: hypothetical protein E7584_03610 [Ruminococcaceae bacterium]|nr:hypothetical protein [Oscillospiraceae bacterium]
MDENMRFEFKPQYDFESECKSVELEIINPTSEIDARLDEIESKIADLDISIDKFTNHADRADYAVAVASGILTGFIDAIFVGKTDIDINKIQEELEEKFHTVNDSAYKHKVIKDDGKEGWVSSSQYHRLEDLAHHPTMWGLLAAIAARFFRIAVFSNSSEGKTRIFLIDKHSNPDTYKEEMKDMCVAWSLAVLSGVMVWIAQMAKNNETIDENIPTPIKNMIGAVAATPAIIDLMMSADTWAEHILSDVSTSAGVPGIFLSGLKELSMIPGVNKTALPKIVDDLYANKKFNVWKYEGIALTAIKKQILPIVINEVLVRGFYFVRHLLTEYKSNNGFENINWNNVIPFGNRTIERMMTIASGTFTAVDALDAVIEGAITSKGNSAEFGSQVVLRLNFVGIGRFTIALGTDAFMGLRKGKRSRERMLLKAQSLYLLETKMYYGDKLMWSAVKDAEQSVDSLFEAMQHLSVEIVSDMKAIQGSIHEIKDVDVCAIEENNEGLVDELLDIL